MVIRPVESVAIRAICFVNGLIGTSVNALDLVNVSRRASKYASNNEMSMTFNLSVVTGWIPPRILSVTYAGLLLTCLSFWFVDNIKISPWN